MNVPLALIRTMRPDQWTKNLILFAGLIFAGGLTSGVLVGLAAAGFLIFCALSSATYLFNDLIDIGRDRRHPVKSRRPLPSGELPVGVAATAALVLGVGAVYLSYRIGHGFGHVALGYLVLNVLYSVALRRMVILDVMAIAIGFVLRAVASVEVLVGAAPGTEISPWLLVCTFFLALFLGLGKRRHEVLILGESAGEHRSTLEFYAPPLIDPLLGVVTASAVVSYAIYTIWPGTVEKVGSAALVYTVPFVVYGVFRYLYLMFAEGEGGRPSRSLVSDVPLAVNIFLWILAVSVIIYLR
ncbi:MAG: decaprenyl-phosphate phosphoribosyltransferase [Candidatus Eisenbacteria bacterium]|nr:decaprenyl-phosphate phosphoribosyltransferase [Candidatus Eisenbacteria bacterium]